MGNRPSWEEYAMILAHAASMRSEDPYVKVGACVLRHDYSVAALGYNGPPSGVSIDWSNRDERRPKVIHAEKNALRYVKPDEGKLIAVTLLPCSTCMAEIAANRIKTILYSNVYERDERAASLAKEFGIRLIQVSLNDDFLSLKAKVV